MSTPNTVIAQLRSLLDAANGITGGSDPELTSAVATLGAGYGQQAVLEPLTATENGIYTPPEGVDGFDAVTVEVEVESEGVSEQELIDAIATGLLPNNEIVITAERVRDYAFYGAAITKVLAPNATIATYAFANCSSLVEAGIPAATTLNAGTFENCSSLLKVDCSNVEYLTGYNQFRYCTSLERLVFPRLKKANGNVFYSFAKTDKLLYIDFWELESYNFSSSFVYGSGCQAIFLRNTAVTASLASAANINQGNFGSGKTGFIYVPKTMDDGTDGISAYEAATNWATFAGSFRYVEDYTVDGTLTGEIDESKLTA